ncbi:MAG: hypothetical protein MUC36_04125 [Planctomycetes bacterium]|jgi:hypothetical protein|nr:hypothetical protein [Planctomycetota bacterium]
MTEAKQPEPLLGNDQLRLVDVLLEEVCAGPVAPARLPPLRRHRDQWLVAALVLMGVGVAFGVAVLSRPAASPAQDPQPAPRPAPGPTPDPTALLREALGSVLEVGKAPTRDHDLDWLAVWRPEVTDAPRKAEQPRLPSPSDPGPGTIFLRDEALKAPRQVEPLPPDVALLRDLFPSDASRASLLSAEFTDAAELARQPSHLWSLRCDGGDSYELAQALPRFTSLRRVELGPLFDDHVANALANGRQIEELIAGCRGLTDEGLQRLTRLTSLRTMVLWGDVSKLAGRAFRDLPRLQTLRLAAAIDTRRRGPGGLDLLQSVLHMWQLHELQLVLTSLPPPNSDGRSPLLAPLVAMPALRRLSVVVQSGPASALVRDLSLLHLQRLQIHSEELSAADVEALAGLPSLVELHLGDAQFQAPEAAVASLAQLPHLRRLVLGRTNLSLTDCTTLMRELPGCVIYVDRARLAADGTMEWTRFARSAGAANRSPR